MRKLSTTNFNSRPCERGDRRIGKSTYQKIIFQFSPLREGRPRSGSSPQRRPYFNSRPCERGDASQAPRFHQAAISILAPARGATDSTAIRWYIQAFQFSPLREGRLHPSTYKIAKSHFNSRPCERGDHLLTEYNADTGLFQFSPLREGRPTQYVLRSASQFISILAPARGATIPPEDLVFGTVISILAPARGATQHARTTPPAKLFQFSPLREGRRCTRSNRYHRDTYFNSRPCERGDIVGMLFPPYDQFQFSPLREGRPDPQFGERHGYGISILAPARGATCRRSKGLRVLCNFNSRPCERGDAIGAFYAIGAALFQFSPLREGRRRSASRACRWRRYFNSRPCERGDANAATAKITARQFQFSPLREGRHTLNTLVQDVAKFQFSPLREGRLCQRAQQHGSANFNSRPCERGDTTAL